MFRDGRDKRAPALSAASEPELIAGRAGEREPSDLTREIRKR